MLSFNVFNEEMYDFFPAISCFFKLSNQSLFWSRCLLKKTWTSLCQLLAWKSKKHPSNPQ